MAVINSKPYEIAGLVLTYNEEANIRRTLTQLTWMPEIVVVDSYSSDQTISICQEFDNVVIHKREFDNHTNQWNYGLDKCTNTAEWLLALDADYFIPDELSEEIQNLLYKSGIPYNGFWVNFKYAIEGVVIHSSIYPPVQILYRIDNAKYVNEGHTQRIKVKGRSGWLKNSVVHDDRKPFDRWLISQNKYAKLEAEYLLDKESKNGRNKRQDSIRLRHKLTPVFLFLYCILVRSGWRDGKAGWLYAFQKLIAEVLLQYHLILKRFKQD